MAKISSSAKNRWGWGASLLVMTVALSGGAAHAQEAATADDEIVVTGFRGSLAAALDLKRNSVSSVDVIVAEDIAKFPDQNLAEALQRIPGISIQRDAGEGRAITVRGLGAQFTRVRVNGLETIATSTDGASANRDRQFDFNVFASELFSSVVVHKTAEASLDEGSLGAVVDLNTGNPLNGQDGLTLALSALGSYNDLAETWGPRIAGLVGYKAPDGTWAVSASAAFSSTDTLELGNNTVRWAQARFDSVGGVNCFTTPNAGGAYVPSAGCNAAALAFHPRIPRYGEVSHERERLGLTGSFQFRPSDSLEVSVDALFSRFDETRDEYWAEVLLRSNERSIDLVNYTVDADNTMVTGTLNDAWVRTERYSRESTTEFQQYSTNITQDFSDTFRVHFLGGFSQSNADIPIESTLVFDDRDAQNYSFDYTNSRSPRLTFGTSVTNPANFQLAEIRDRPSNVTNEFQTAALDATWDATDALTLKGGAVYREFSFDSEAFTRDTVVCPAAGPDRVLGTTTCTGTNFGAAAVYGLPVLPGIGELFTLGDAGQPNGTTTQWLVPNLASGAAYANLYSRPAAIDTGNVRGVVEQTTGGFVQATLRTEVLGMDFTADAGVRYVETQQESTGINSGVAVTVERQYEDVLPAFNLVLSPTEDIIVRASVADVLTRPTLANLTPGGTVDGFNFRVNFGNPFLDPFRARAFDLAFEYYFAPESIFSVALFSKDVDSFPVAVSTTGSYASTGLPTSIINPASPGGINPGAQDWTISTIGNGSGATLEGVEISVQAPFTFLPGFWSNFGGLANATFVTSEATYTVSGPAIVPGGANIAATRTSTLFGLSEEAYNGTIYYEDDKFSARMSVSYRGPYVDANSATGNVFEGYNEAINYDGSVRYRVNDRLELSLEGINLTDEFRDRYTDLDADRTYEYNHFGRTFLVGLRYRN